MLRVFVLVSTPFLLGLACIQSPPPPLTIEPLARQVDFTRDVKPLLEALGYHD